MSTPVEAASAVANREEAVKATMVVATSVAGFLAVAVATEAAAVAIEAEEWNWVMVALVAAAMVEVATVEVTVMALEVIVVVRAATAVVKVTAARAIARVTRVAALAVTAEHLRVWVVTVVTVVTGRPAWSVRPRQSLGHSDQGHDRDDTHSSTMPARPTSKLPPGTKQLYSPTQTKAASTNLMLKVRMPGSHHCLSLSLLLGDGWRVAASLCSCSVPAAPLLAGL